MDIKFNKKKVISPIILMIFIMIGGAYAFDFKSDNIMYYSYDEKDYSGTTLSDLSDNEYNGSCVNMQGECNIVTGKLNTSNDFDGNEDWINTTITPEDVFTDKITISTWIYSTKQTTGGESQGIISSDRTNGLERSFGLTMSDNIAFNIFNTAGNNNFVRYDNFLSGDSTWHHIVATYDGTEIKLYVDNVLIETAPFTGNIQGTGYIEIGHSSYDDALYRYFGGLIDETAIFNNSLNESEVNQLYNSNEAYNFYSGVIINKNMDFEGFNFTADVQEVTLNLSTSLASECTYEYNNTITNFTETGNLTHTSIFNMPAGTNKTQEINIDFECTDIESNTTDTDSITFYKQGEPLEFDIIIPEDEQVFNYDTNEIEFHMLTNYVALCSHKTTNSTEFVNFTQTNNSVHKTNFSVLEDFNTYETTFRCYSDYVNETQEVNVTFYIDEEPEAPQTGLVGVQETTNMVFSSTDTLFGIVAGFFTNSIAYMIVSLSIVGFVISLFAMLIVFTKKYIKKSIENKGNK